jgi:hypothetical protein
MAELILKPAGVSPEIYRPLLHKRDETIGRALSNRQLAPFLLDAIQQRPEGPIVIRALIEIASRWSNFHLADNEFAARATVQKAREFLGVLETMEAWEAKQRELARKQELARMERERVELIAKQSELLLMMFDDLSKSDDPHRRGYLLQDLLNRTFDLHQIPLTKPFTRNEGAEQIDGAFKMEGWHYLVECRWRQKLANIRELDGFKGQVDRSGKPTMGLFLSINGWSEHVPRVLKQNPEKSIILMDGYDLRTVLTGQVDLHAFLLAKVAKLSLDGEPFLSTAKYLKGSA